MSKKTITFITIALLSCANPIDLFSMNKSKSKKRKLLKQAIKKNMFLFNSGCYGYSGDKGVKVQVSPTNKQKPKKNIFSKVPSDEELIDRMHKKSLKKKEAKQNKVDQKVLC